MNQTTHDTISTPPGCSITAHSNGTEVIFNTAASSSVKCGTLSGPVRAMGSTSGVNPLKLHLELNGKTENATITISGPDGVWFAVGFNAANMADLPYTIIVDGKGEVTERKLANHMPGTQLIKSVEVLSNTVGPPPPVAQPVKMNYRGDQVGRMKAQSWTNCHAICVKNAQCEAWTFVPGYFSTVYNLQSSSCTLHKRLLSSNGFPLEDNHLPGQNATADIMPGFTSIGWKEGMISGEIQSERRSIRTLVLRRPLKGKTLDHYTFNASAPSIPFINAIGTTADFQYHGKLRGGGDIVMVQVGAPVCICEGSVSGGSINGIPWSNNCEKFPATTILRDHNPSCDIKTYGGGMICCHHGIFLLDKEQDIPPQTFRFRMKYRFWYEDPHAKSSQPVGSVASLFHGLTYQNAFFMFRETEVSHGEYDVPQCLPGTPPENCVHTIIGQFQIKDAMHKCTGQSDVWCSPVNIPNATYPQSTHIALVHVSPHCHGPACISMEMINRDTNSTICYTEPHYGNSNDAMNEAGYAAGIPPCIWGSKQDGLLPPPILSLETNITVIKRANSTVKHYGVMGHWQMRGIWASDPDLVKIQ